MVDDLDPQASGEDVDVDATVTVDVVSAAQSEDRVVARATGEVVAGLAADDEVVALAAVGGEADRRQRTVSVTGRAGDPREQAAGVDDVVAEEVVRVGDRHQPLVVLVLRLGDLPERIERLGPELLALHAERLARVPDGILRGVAVDDERRVRPGDRLGAVLATARLVGVGRQVADRDPVAAHPGAAVVVGVGARHGEEDRREDLLVGRRAVDVDHVGRLQGGALEHERVGVGGHDGEHAGETGDADLHAGLEHRAAAPGAAEASGDGARESAGRQTERSGRLDGDVHQVGGRDDADLGDVDGPLDRRDVRLIRHRRTRGRGAVDHPMQQEGGVEPAARERVDDRAGAVDHLDDGPRDRAGAGDLDTIADVEPAVEP